MHVDMRDRMERLVLLPFSIGCVSESSVAIGVHQPRRTKPENNNPNSSSAIRTKEEDEESLSSSESMKNSLKFLALSKPNISAGFHRLCRGFKTFSQLFAYKDEMEEVDMEMEIGLPTDVKHVTHIGWDGTADSITNQFQGWDNLMAAPDQLLSVPIRRQFQLSMADPPLVRPSSA